MQTFNHPSGAMRYAAPHLRARSLPTMIGVGLLGVFAPLLAEAGSPHPESWVDPTFAATATNPGWRRVYSSGVLNERGVAMARTSDGGYITLISVPGGTFGNKIGLQRYTSNGEIVTSGFGAMGTGKVLKDASLFEVTGMLIDSYGRIIVIGTTPGLGGVTDFGVVRFNPDGSDDVSFGGDGMVVAGFDTVGSPTSDRPVVALEQVPDSRLVVGGNSRLNVAGEKTHIGLIRLNENGSVDASFGNLGNQPGHTLYEYADDQEATLGALITTAGQQLVVAGSTKFASTDTDFAACRLTRDGLAYDGHQGCLSMAMDVTSPDNTLYDGVTAAAARYGDGSIVLAGNASGKMAAARVQLIESGTLHQLKLDTNFLGNGDPNRPNRYIGSIGGVDVRDVALRENGRFVMVGSFSSPYPPFNVSGVVQSLTANGSPDLAFADLGIEFYTAPTTTSGVSPVTEFVKVRIDNDKVVLFGSSPDDTSLPASDFDGVLVRLQADRIFANSFEQP